MVSVIPGRETTTLSPEETRKLAAEVLRLAAPDGVILLFGPLGSGKTTFVKGLAAAAGVDADDVGSPSFTLINEYTTGKVPIYHFDLYRLTATSQFVEIGGVEYLEREGIKVVEWAEHALELMPKARFEITFAIAGETSRQIMVQRAGS
jgi:tRNA threonylcarbamoyladenosine biosynthesis protein TsaE